MPVPRTISHPSGGTAALRRASRDVLSSKDAVQGVGCPSQPPCPCGIRSLPVLLVATYRKRGFAGFSSQFFLSCQSWGGGKGPIKPPWFNATSFCWKGTRPTHWYLYSCTVKAPSSPSQMCFVRLTAVPQVAPELPAPATVHIQRKNEHTSCSF